MIRDKEQWQEKDKQMEKKKEKETVIWCKYEK